MLLMLNVNNFKSRKTMQIIVYIFISYAFLYNYVGGFLVRPFLFFTEGLYACEFPCTCIYTIIALN